MTRKNLVITFFILLIIVLAFVAIISLNKFRPGEVTTVPPKIIEITPLVSITSQGFVPETIKIKKGEQVKWTNTDTASHQVASDPYPTHSNLPGLFSMTLLKDNVYTFTF